MSSRRKFFTMTIICAFSLTCMIFLKSFNKKNSSFSAKFRLQCVSKRKVGFLKIHKCASSTIQNIFLRHAYLNNINVAVPPEEYNNYLGNPHHFEAKLLKNSPGHYGGFEMFLLHTRWDHQEVSKVLGPNTFYVTILRHPVDLFESLFAYGHLDKFYGGSLVEFIEHLERNNITDVQRMRLNGRYGWNQISWDFGLMPRDFARPKKIKDFIRSVEENFHLVMIAEQIEKSLVILKSSLCWSIEDVTSLKLNERKAGNKEALSKRQRETLEEWLSADMMIYKYFLRRFEEKVSEFDSVYLDQEVEKLKKANELVQRNCVLGLNKHDEISNLKSRPYSDEVIVVRVRDVSFFSLLQGNKYEKNNMAYMYFFISGGHIPPTFVANNVKPSTLSHIKQFVVTNCSKERPGSIVT
ncbi:hypothetical protein QYM36_016695, partial [Artemia franciscana]